MAKDDLELPPVQRLTLARILLDLTEEDADFSFQVEAAWDEEICRRMQAVRAGTARSRGFERVFADLDRRFPKRSLESSRRRKKNEVRGQRPEGGSQGNNQC